MKSNTGCQGKKTNDILTAMQAYTSDEASNRYIEFLNSANGQLFKKYIFNAVSSQLGANRSQTILDAACGAGWLTASVAKQYPSIVGCDASEQLIAHAKKTYAPLQFDSADLTQKLPYAPETFDTVILSMVIHDLADQPKTFTELARILKPGGKIICTLVNPYYGYPVGVWKRGKLGALLGKLPKLKLRSYQAYARKTDRRFIWNDYLGSYFYTLPEHINNFIKTGFSLRYMADFTSDHDSDLFTLDYQLYRFPLILLLEFTKN